MTPIAPEGGFFIVADTSKVVVPEKYMMETTKAAPVMTRDWAFCRYLTIEHKVAAIPPSAFFEGKDKGYADIPVDEDLLNQAIEANVRYQMKAVLDNSELLNINSLPNAAVVNQSINVINIEKLKYKSWGIGNVTDDIVQTAIPLLGSVYVLEDGIRNNSTPANQAQQAIPVDYDLSEDESVEQRFMFADRITTITWGTGVNFR
jgi:hypothetical protein